MAELTGPNAAFKINNGQIDDRESNIKVDFLTVLLLATQGLTLVS